VQAENFRYFLHPVAVFCVGKAYQAIAFFFERLPERDSHPLDYATLPGRNQDLPPLLLNQRFLEMQKIQIPLRKITTHVINVL